MSAVKHRKACARCGKQLPADQQRRIYSAHTRNYFCTDIDACGCRARRAKRVAA